LIHHFLKKFNQKYELQIKSISDGEEEKLTNYNWPGNVRELENKIERAMVTSEKQVLEDKDFELELEHTYGDSKPFTAQGMWKHIVEGRVKIENITHFKQKWGENMLKDLITKAFAKTKSQKEAGKLLGCYTKAEEEPKKYSTFRQECTKLGIKIKSYKSGR